MIRVAIVIKNINDREALAKAFRRDLRFQLIGALDSFGPLLDLSRSVNIRCIICEATAKDMDYIECFHRMRYKFAEETPKFVILSSTLSTASFEKMLNLGATDVLHSGTNTSDLLDRIARTIKDESQLMIRENIIQYSTPDKELKSWLMRLEISPKLNAHKYLTMAISACLNDKRLLHNVTNNLYEEIAEFYGTKVENVERSIRHGIIVMWKNANARYINELFNNPYKATGKRPSNCELISALYEKVSEVHKPEEQPEIQVVAQHEYIHRGQSQDALMLLDDNEEIDL